MKMQPFLDEAMKLCPAQVTPLVEEYCYWADKLEEEKPYYYGTNSLKWVLYKIRELSLTDAQEKTMVHHIILELYVSDDAKNKIQFDAGRLNAFRPWKQFLISQNQEVDIKDLPRFQVMKFLFIENETTHSLTSRIFKGTRADGIVFRNPEIKSSGIIFRVNSRINQIDELKDYILSQLQSIENGWETFGDDRHMIVNYGIRSQSPSVITIDSLKKILNDYFNKVYFTISDNFIEEDE